MQADAAYARLREEIVDGGYPAGSRLTEVELAEKLGMSRTPVREALRRLAGDGLVRASDRGVIVDLMDADEARHARAVRAALDVLVAELAARRQRAGEISPAALRAAEEAAEKAEASLSGGDVEAAYEYDQQLHRHIAELAGNPVALQMLERLADRLSVARSTLGQNGNAQSAEDLAEEHRRILSAIAAGQPAAAWLAAREHAHG